MTMIETIRSLVAYVIVLGILVFFHELGHYLAARARGVTVEAFSIGFGPALLSWRAKSGTVWKLSVLPLGGYVKMQGWGEAQDAPKLPGSFAATSLGSKALIVAAGPIANLILAFFLFAGLFAINGRIVVEPVISQVFPGSAAAIGGLLPGDRIINIGGHQIRHFDDMVDIIAMHPDTEMVFRFKRGTQMETKQITVGHKDLNGDEIGSLGIEGDQVSSQHFSPAGAVAAAAAETWTDTSNTLDGLYNLIVHQQGLHNLAGPLGIAQITGKVATFGLPSLVNLLALLSINLGLVNLVPIPILDGGHLLFYGAEAIYGRPIPKRALDVGLRFGFAVIVSLFVFTTFNDLTRLGAVHWVAHLFG
jgi:regulator of sigma E protease